MTKERLARRIYFSLDRQMRIARLGADVDPADELPPNMKDAILELIDEAFDVMETEGSGYDPRSDARPMAEQAVIHYCKSIVTGAEASLDQRWNVLVKQWVKSAAKLEGRQGPKTSRA